MQLVIVPAAAEHQQAGEGGNGGADLVRDDEPVAADELLLGEERAHEAVVPRPQFRGHASPRRHVALDVSRQAVRQRPCERLAASAHREPGSDGEPGEHGDRDQRDRHCHAHSLSPVS